MSSLLRELIVVPRMQSIVYPRSIVACCKLDMLIADIENERGGGRKRVINCRVKIQINTINKVIQYCTIIKLISKIAN